MSAADLPPLRDVIARFGLKARRSLGQNFLLDGNLTDKIVRAAAPLDGRTVIEVGPGPGGLTRSLLDSEAAGIIAVERDARCIAALEDLRHVYGDRLEIVEGDALAIDWNAYVAPPSAIVANLPYNVATVLLTRWLACEPWPAWFEAMTLMFQKEVAARLCAAPGSREYGRLSVLAQWRCQVSHVFDIPARAFTPAPKVMSSVVALKPRPTPEPHCSRSALERVTAAAFGQRRKMLRSSLKSLVAEPAALLEAAGIDERERAEQIDIPGFCRLAACLETPAHAKS